MAKEQADYVSYLLRLWRAKTAGESPYGKEQAMWRASLESSLTGKRQGFACLDDLFDFLRHQTVTLADVNEGED